MSSKAIFLDRDGTINMDVGYPSDIGDLTLLPGSIEAIKSLNQQGLKVIVISNQSGIERGLFDHAEVDGFNLELNKRLRAQNARIDSFYYCPHAPAENGDTICDCRKPGTGLFDRAKAELDLDLQSSFMVGDRISDIAAGASCGCRTILLCEHNSSESTTGIIPDFVAPDLKKAVEWILSQIGNDLIVRKK